MKRPNLIFDVGMHRGEDTAHYLRNGFDVVAVEANPDLVKEMEVRFRDAIAAGRLTIVAAAVAEEPGTLCLSVSDDITVWSTTDNALIARNENLWGTRYRKVGVPAVRFADLLTEHGIPHYLKVDIEGSDMLCVQALHAFRERPNYISLESAVTLPKAGFESVFDELAELWTLGYRGFKLVDQMRLGNHVAADASGPFGEDAKGRWRPIGRALARSMATRLEFDIGGFGGRWGQTIPGRAYRKFRIDVLKRPQGWYDLHARLG